MFVNNDDELMIITSQSQKILPHAKLKVQRRHLGCYSTHCSQIEPSLAIIIIITIISTERAKKSFP